MGCIKSTPTNNLLAEAGEWRDPIGEQKSMDMYKVGTKTTSTLGRQTDWSPASPLYAMYRDIFLSVSRVLQVSYYLLYQKSKIAFLYNFSQRR